LHNTGPDYTNNAAQGY